MQGLEMARHNDLLHAVQHLDPALHLFALRGLVAEALYELLGAFDFRLLALVGRLQLLYLEPALILVERVISAVSC